ncbi:MAG: SBBP repeat-containing protein, partial [Flavobacteriales bacterium]
AQATPRAPAVNSELSSRSAAPSGFEENKGQVITKTGETASFVRYRLSEGNTRIFLLNNGIAYQFNGTHYPEGYAELEQRERLDATKHEELEVLRKEIRLETYRMDMLLEGANANARITTEGRSTDFTQYYNHDALDVHTYSRVTYHEVYPGIDWVVYTTPKGMKYDFVLRPGADPALIQLRFKGHEELRVDADGQLIHGNRMGRFTEQPPVSFQNGREVATRFVLEGDRLRFALAAYDRSQPLTIDPDRSWGTYYGGAGWDEGRSCAVDGSGNVFMAGTTWSDDHIAIYGHDYTLGGFKDAFLVKFNAGGVRQWGTFYGGPDSEEGGSCATDGDGNVYMTGSTTSLSAIASGGHQNTNGGSTDAFLVKFNGNGIRQWATYYGGPYGDNGSVCTVDGGGNVYIAGGTGSTSGIAFSGHQNACGGSNDGFLVKFNSAGVRQWATYYGGSGIEQAMACVVSAAGEVYLAGATDSNNAISYLGFQNTYGGGPWDAFLVKFSPSGVRQWGTY